MSLGIQCLLAQTDEEALTLAHVLDNFNKDRRSIEKNIHKEALSALETHLTEEQYSIVAHQNNWHQGVIGIVASRLKERYYRPTIVFASSDNGELKGSGRSIIGFHLRDGLDWVSKQNTQLICKFGGHAMAAGLTIKEENLTQFKALFEQAVQKFVPKEKLYKSFITDGQLPIEDLSLENALTVNVADCPLLKYIFPRSSLG